MIDLRLAFTLTNRSSRSLKHLTLRRNERYHSEFHGLGAKQRPFRLYREVTPPVLRPRLFEPVHWPGKGTLFRPT